MKAYTLRIEDNLLNTLKHIGIETHKSVREILLDAAKKEIDFYKNIIKFENISNKEDLEAKKISRILSKCSDKNIVTSIQSDRQR
ncbi:hypothetical protein MNBD_UNCLBAC01-1657 [hydrothermal vent metagenome]|uniref:Ribbon-helix-helix protein CopG domain-containing protein n=1 Tax=hydrothermal vent metagenome TaxID=652676 RepID=A0A3B1DA73_9ZZZZ